MTRFPIGRSLLFTSISKNLALRTNHLQDDAPETTTSIIDNVA
jgi:hypothetical protein